jgi:hypothetical protein
MHAAAKTAHHRLQLHLSNNGLSSRSYWPQKQKLSKERVLKGNAF